MGRTIAVRTDYRSGDVRRIAQRVKNAAQARRLLAIATVLDGAARQEAAKIGGMDRQTLRDWVIRFNEQRPDGLINKVSPGAPGKLTNEHKAFLARLVEDGPIPALDGGRLVFLIYEMVTRRRANPKIETMVHMAGIMALGVVMLVVLYIDLRRVVHL